MNKSAWTVAMLVCALVGVAQAEYSQDFEGPEYQAIGGPDNEEAVVDGMIGVDFWTGSTGPHRFMETQNLFGRVTAAPQLCCASNAFLIREFQPGEKGLYRFYQFSGIPVVDGVRLDMTISSSTNLGVAGSRIGFGFDGNDVALYSDGCNPADVRAVDAVDPLTWTDLRIELLPGTGRVELSYAPTGTNGWTVVGQQDMPPNWGGELQEPAIMSFFANNTNNGPIFDNVRAFIPEPTTIALLSIGGLLALKRRRA